MIIALIFIVIVVLFFLNANAKGRAVDRKATEKELRDGRDEMRRRQEAILNERESIPSGHGLSTVGYHIKLSQEQITLLRKPTSEYTKLEWDRRGHIMDRFKNYNVSE